MVAALAAVLLAGVVGLVSAGAFTRTDTTRTTAISGVDDSSSHHRATITTAQSGDHHVTLDLTAVAPEAVPLLAALVTAIAAARVATGRRQTAVGGPDGRAPPLR